MYEQYEVTKDGVRVFGPSTADECWLFLHRTSSGSSVEWLCRFEGYEIRKVEVSPYGSVHPSCR